MQLSRGLCGRGMKRRVGIGVGVDVAISIHDFEEFFGLNFGQQRVSPELIVPHQHHNRRQFMAEFLLRCHEQVLVGQLFVLVLKLQGGIEKSIDPGLKFGNLGLPLWTVGHELLVLVVEDESEEVVLVDDVVVDGIDIVDPQVPRTLDLQSEVVAVFQDEPFLLPRVQLLGQGDHFLDALDLPIQRLGYIPVVLVLQGGDIQVLEGFGSNAAMAHNRVFLVVDNDDVMLAQQLKDEGLVSVLLLGQLIPLQVPDPPELVLEDTDGLLPAEAVVPAGVRLGGRCHSPPFVVVQAAQGPVELQVHLRTLPLEVLYFRILVAVVEELEVGTGHHLVVVVCVYDQASALPGDAVFEVGCEEVVQLHQVGVLRMFFVTHAIVGKQVDQPVLPQVVDDIQLPNGELLHEFRVVDLHSGGLGNVVQL